MSYFSGSFFEVQSEPIYNAQQYAPHGRTGEAQTELLFIFFILL